MINLVGDSAVMVGPGEFVVGDSMLNRGSVVSLVVCPESIVVGPRDSVVSVDSLVVAGDFEADRALWSN